MVVVCSTFGTEDDGDDPKSPSLATLTPKANAATKRVKPTATAIAM